MLIHPQKGDFTLPHEVNTLLIHLFFVCALPQEVNTTRGKLFFAYTLYLKKFDSSYVGKVSVLTIKVKYYII